MTTLAGLAALSPLAYLALGLRVMYALVGGVRSGALYVELDGPGV